MNDEIKQSDYLKEKAWHGLSCCCVGRYSLDALPFTQRRVNARGHPMNP